MEEMALVERTESMMEMLPVTISSNVFARLPVDLISRFTLVSKRWRHLMRTVVESPGFGHLQLQMSNHHNRGFLFVIGSRDTDTEGDFRLYLAQPYINDLLPCNVKVITSPAWTSARSWKLVGSCNGIICLGKPMLNNSVDPVLLYNPILREYRFIPQLTTNYPVAIGFGFHPAAEKKKYKYKVVRIAYTGDGLGHVEMYTLGQGCAWEPLGTTPYQLHDSDAPGVSAKGSLHWLTHLDSSAGFGQGSQIVSLDLCTRLFDIIPLPTHGLHYEDVLTDLIEVGGLLCFVQNRLEEGLMDVWILRGEEGWVLKRVVTLDWWLYSSFEACDFRHNEEQVLLCCTADEVVEEEEEEPNNVFVHEQLIWFRTQVDDDALPNYDNDIALIMSKRGFRKSAVVAHINTFVSLKDLGEEDTTVLAPQVQDIPSAY